MFIFLASHCASSDNQHKKRFHAAMPEVIEAINEIQGGASIQATARNTGIPASSLHQFMKRYGVRSQHRGSPRGVRRKPYAPRNTFTSDNSTSLPAFDEQFGPAMTGVSESEIKPNLLESESSANSYSDIDFTES